MHVYNHRQRTDLRHACVPYDRIVHLMYMILFMKHALGRENVSYICDLPFLERSRVQRIFFY